MLRTPLFVGFLAFVLAAAFSLGTAVLAAMVIERRSIEAVDTALLADGQDWAVVSADGLRVFLDGTAPDEAASARAITRAGAIVDANRIVNRVEVAVADTSAPPRFSLDMLRNGDGVQLIGLIPASTGNDAVDAAVAEFADGVEITDMVELADHPAPDTWEDALAYGLRALGTLPRSKVTVLADRVEIEAISESIEQRATFIAALERRMPRGVEVVLDISAPRPVITPFAFRAVHDGNGLRLETCTADSAEAANRIRLALEEAGIRRLITCPVGLGAPTPSWSDAVVSGLEALRMLEMGGTLSISDADVTLVAAQDTPQDMFDTAMGRLQNALPPLFSLQGVLPEPSNTTDQGPDRFVATRDPETGAVLRGRLPQGEIGESVLAYAVAAFGVDGTEIATRSVDDLPPRWALRAMAGLDALAELHDGQITVEPETLIVSGRSGDPDIVSLLTRQLTERLGTGSTFELDVAYDISLDPVASLPDAQTCVDRIQAVQDDGKIIFEPGSVEITGEAGEILDRIAELLPDCQHVRMEIGGHTDSQGREEMNLGLSQSRADAVLNGLLARGVLISNLTARGYGESRPIADNGTEEGRELNRRIEFRLYEDVEAEREEAEARQADIYRPRPRPQSVLDAAVAAAEEAEAEDGDDAPTEAAEADAEAEAAAGDAGDADAPEAEE